MNQRSNGLNAHFFVVKIEIIGLRGKREPGILTTFLANSARPKVHICQTLACMICYSLLRGIFSLDPEIKRRTRAAETIQVSSEREREMLTSSVKEMAGWKRCRKEEMRSGEKEFPVSKNKVVPSSL